MRPGSIVVTLKVEGHPVWEPFLKWLPAMDEETPYMLREIVETPDGTGVKFEEGIIGTLPDGTEIVFPIEKVREILPPEDISEVVEEMMMVPIEASHKALDNFSRQMWKAWCNQ